MNTNNKANIPLTTLETLARSFYKETMAYGFQQVDYVKFVNFMLDCAMKEDVNFNSGSEMESPLNTDLLLSDTQSCHSLPLKGKTVEVRSFNPKTDKKLLEKWTETDFGRNFLLCRTTAKKLSIERLIDDDTNVVGMIELPHGDAIGIIAFLDFDENQKKAELRKMIGEKSNWGKGYTREATKLWIQYGKSAMKLKKIYLNTLNTNIRNIKLNEDLGFRVEGILRNEVKVDGEYKDVLRMGLLID